MPKTTKTKTAAATSKPTKAKTKAKTQATPKGAKGRVAKAAIAATKTKAKTKSASPGSLKRAPMKTKRRQHRKGSIVQLPKGALAHAGARPALKAVETTHPTDQYSELFTFAQPTGGARQVWQDITREASTLAKTIGSIPSGVNTRVQTFLEQAMLSLQQATFWSHQALTA